MIPNCMDKQHIHVRELTWSKPTNMAWLPFIKPSLVPCILDWERSYQTKLLFNGFHCMHVCIIIPGSVDWERVVLLTKHMHIYIIIIILSIGLGQWFI